MNMIENSFSAIKAGFRTRPVFQSVAEEIAYLSTLFFNDDNKKKFKGYTRNLLRTIVRMSDDVIDQE